MPTVQELKEQARHLEIEGYSSLNKAELEQAIRDAGGNPDPDASGDESRIDQTPADVRETPEGATVEQESRVEAESPEEEGPSVEVFTHRATAQSFEATPDEGVAEEQQPRSMETPLGSHLRDETVTVQPVTPTDGGDGAVAHQTEAGKETAYTWKPFVPPDPPAGVDPAPATRTETTGDDTSAIPAGLSDF